MTSYSEPADAAALAAALIERVDRATARLLETAAGLSDEQVREPSLLPGWSRGHVLTHLARNADSLRNLLIWARTGVETPQYASRAARDEAIAAGSGRSASELLADLQASAQQLAAEAARLSPANWTAEVRGLGGAAHPGLVHAPAPPVRGRDSPRRPRRRLLARRLAGRVRGRAPEIGRRRLR